MAIPDILFKGVPRRFTRGYTAEVLERVRPTKVVIPCVGAYALATTVVEAGVPASAIEACDISLYTSVIGHYLAGRPFRLVAQGQYEWLNEYMVDPATGQTDPAGQVAAVTVGIRLCQYAAKRDTLYTRERTREVKERASIYIAQARAAAEAMFQKLGGLQYRSEDMWDLLRRNLDTADPERTVLLVNPPRYTGGYVKMYEGVEAAFDWDQPSVSQFDESHYGQLMDELRGGPLTLMYYATPASEPEDPSVLWGWPWKGVFAARPKMGRTAAINWIVSNKPEILDEKLQRADVEDNIPAKYKLAREREITVDTDLRVIPESKEVASYYRDLFIHNLGHLNAERYKVLLVDGELMSTVGLHLQNLRAGGSMQGVAKLRFAMTVRNIHHPKLHKLALMCVVSSWFWQDELSDIEPLPVSVQTTMLTKHPEVKTARGIMEMKGREFDKQAQLNKLTYYADIVVRTPKETIEAWIRKGWHR